jgi:hypothetical protein
MHRTIVLVGALMMALVLGFAGGASAQEEEVGADALYLDADGNVDYELAKEYAEIVDGWVDEDGTEWEVWLDEAGARMWVEYLTPDGLLGDEELFVPSWITLFQSGDSVTYNYYGSADGNIDYDTACGRRCFLWGACHYPGYPPSDIAGIQAKAVSDEDYCDDDHKAFYDFPNGVTGSWVPVASDSCGAAGRTTIIYCMTAHRTATTTTALGRTW